MNRQRDLVEFLTRYPGRWHGSALFDAMDVPRGQYIRRPYYDALQQLAARGAIQTGGYGVTRWYAALANE